MKKIFALSILLLLCSLNVYGEDKIFIDDSATTTGHFLGYPFGPIIVKVEIINNEMHITYRESSSVMYPEGGGPPDKVWKEVYAAEDGNIVHVRTVNAKVTPEHTVPEKIEFEE